ncbi:MAG TPA: hypothetical protein VFF11_09120 [Candidatus Binatia bacterium]|nr:hypothetical protein [Candidatus Binatia bacterium]
MAFSLTQFQGVFEILDPAGNPYIIVGGQAVNYWAETYLQSEPELSSFIPFVSKDIDFLGGREDVLKVARHLNLTVKFPHRKMMTAFAGAVLFKVGAASANVEFIRAVPGVSSLEVKKWAVTARSGGKIVRVIDPISLLICKLNLALTVDQSSRRDADHARMLLLCTRAFLRETLHGVEAGELPARGWLGAAERVLKIAESKMGRNTARKLPFQWPKVLPETEIAACKNRLVIRFRQERLTQWLEKIQRPARQKTP